MSTNWWIAWICVSQGMGLGAICIPRLRFGHTMPCPQGRVGDGHKVGIADFDGGAVARLSKDLGSGSLAVQMDVGNKNSVGNMVREERSRFGDIDVLLNGAGIMPRHHVKDITEEEWDGVTTSRWFYSS